MGFEVLGLEASVPSLLVGAAIGLAGPPVLKLGRPVLKTVVKAGVLLANQVGETVGEAREQFSDLVAEARSELAKPTPPVGEAAAPAQPAPAQ
jgi:hypothetical protein